MDNLLKGLCRVLIAALPVLTSCSGKEDSLLNAQRVQLPDGLGTLSVRMDTNLIPAGHWVYPSDHTCGPELVWGFGRSGWPRVRDTSYFTPSPDSLFHFTVRVSPLSLEKCDSALSASEWLDTHLIEIPHPGPTAHGFIEKGGTTWSFIFQSNQYSGIYHDRFEGYREYLGRAVLLRWERIAPSAPSHDLGLDWRSQFETATIQPSR